MRIIAEFDRARDIPKLSLWIHDAPHRRMHVKVIQAYRVALRTALAKIGVDIPIAHAIDLDVLFVNPSSPDLGNLYLALEQAMDHTTLSKPGIVADDSLIVRQRTAKFYNVPVPSGHG